MFYLFPLITVAIWAGNAIVNKMAFSVIDPGAISFYRWFFALVVLTPFVAKSVWRDRAIIKTYLTKLAFLGLLGMVLNQSLGYFAAATTTATNIALIISLVPLISMFLSVPILGQRLSPFALIGAVLSLSGLVLMLSHGDVKSLISQGIKQGDMLMLIAAAVYALYCVLLKRWKMPFSTWKSVYVQCFFAVVMLTPLLLMSHRMAITASAVPLIAYAALLASVIAPWLWMLSIERLGADRTAMFMNLLPIMAAGIASVMLNEHLEAYHYIGGIMVLTGVALAQKRIKAKKQAAAMTTA
ncbi:multidrug DMT transporter [Photobacterium angustum]|uniref:DMT family transporter n=1 Tax=Photobacterium angustum TaxID=661 RepID=UPI0005DEE2D2|nr:DMT family transporter [Photobacterium angustum]KJF92332.1 multidrug DMT transporter [Photobacterium angustum]KJG04174.1 multidrug DMT transporter [Photobacterium angustum]PSV95159.1 EamA/RhaT family transporter [Photobacterium angustum]PSW80229.1 EamA/RhaT family transporter [Photobacterium angustum]